MFTRLDSLIYRCQGLDTWILLPTLETDHFSGSRTLGALVQSTGLFSNAMVSLNLGCGRKPHSLRYHSHSKLDL